VGNELVGFFERSGIEQEIDSLAGRHFAVFMLSFAALGASARFGKLVSLLEFFQFLIQIHGGTIIAGESAPDCGRVRSFAQGDR
jgi:hypothetical protein